MASFELKNEQTHILDLGNSTGISATNVSNADAKFYIDYEKTKDHWEPVTGEIKLKPGETSAITKQKIGHDRVRVGAKGKDDGTVIIRGQY